MDLSLSLNHDRFQVSKQKWLNQDCKIVIMKADQDFYDQEPVSSFESHCKWMKEIEFYFQGYSEDLNKILDGTTGHVAELGAGSCGLSACLSRLPNVQVVSALDISQVRMEKMIDFSCLALSGNKRKISPIVGDFNQRLPFSDEELDAILFDASLHHSRSIWRTLDECHRVLKRDGILIAQREAFLSPLRYKSQLKRLLSSSEVISGVSENIYLCDQYLYYLAACGFHSRFIATSPGKLKRILGLLNGSIFCEGVLWASKL